MLRVMSSLCVHACTHYTQTPMGAHIQTHTNAHAHAQTNMGAQGSRPDHAPAWSGTPPLAARACRGPSPCHCRGGGWAWRGAGPCGAALQGPTAHAAADRGTRLGGRLPPPRWRVEAPPSGTHPTRAPALPREHSPLTPCHTTPRSRPAHLSFTLLAAAPAPASACARARMRSRKRGGGVMQK